MPPPAPEAAAPLEAAVEPAEAPAAARAGWAPVVLTWAFLVAVTGAPYLRATLTPPPGTAFVGTFYFKPDVYNYLSYVEQAEGGAFLFRNKLAPHPHAPALINLEWWLAGRLSALLGRATMLGWRLLGIPAALALVLVADAWLRRCGLPSSHRLPALLLVFSGGGFGGLLYWLGWMQRRYHVDLSTGLFPFLEVLSNPHFVIGTALLSGALLAFSSNTRRGTALGIGLTSVAALVRPYDVAMVVLARGVAVALTERPRDWVRRLAPFAALLPVVAYNYWLFYRNEAFRVLSAPTYSIPLLAELVMALSPSLALATLSLRAPGGQEARRARAHLWAWFAVAALLIGARPVSYSLQFLAGIGLPLLALAAVGLSRWGRTAILAAALALSSSAVVVVRAVLRTDLGSFVPAERVHAATALREACRPGEVALAPPDIGLMAIGLSPCSAFVSHPVMPEFERRSTEARGFYTDWPAQMRAGFLEWHCIAAVVLPEDMGAAPTAWLGPATPFRRVSAGSGYAIYARPVEPGCRPRWPG